MNNISSQSSPTVPAIRVLDADASALFDGGEVFSTDIYNLYDLVADGAGLYTCSQGSQSEYLPSDTTPHSAELEDIPELSHLTTTNPAYLTGHGYSLPYPTILQGPGAAAPADGRLSPSTLGSPIPSPTSSFGSSLSPSSLYGSLAVSESELSAPLSPATPDRHFPWPSQGLNHQSSDSLVLHPFVGSFSNVPPSSLCSQTGSRRPRSNSSPTSRLGPVASKAMLEANGRRRRHPAQHACPDCGQTFTALFSLRRHAQSHTGERPFACSIHGCTQRFFNSSDCKRHEKSRKRHKDLMMQ